MQYLYYGGPESLLIKNNEIMEVRDPSWWWLSQVPWVSGTSVNSGRQRAGKCLEGPVLGFHLDEDLGLLFRPDSSVLPDRKGFSSETFPGRLGC